MPLWLKKQIFISGQQTNTNLKTNFFLGGCYTSKFTNYDSPQSYPQKILYFRAETKTPKHLFFYLSLFLKLK